MILNSTSNKAFRLIQHAIQSTKNSNMLNKHGCILSYGRKIITKGYNHYRTKYNNYNPGNVCSCHAEVHAIRQFLNRYGRCHKHHKKKKNRRNKRIK